MLATTLTLTALLAAKTVAVVDLSSPKSPAVAEAFRKIPPLKSVAMPTGRTNAAVNDAESLGLICSVDDGPCLEKLMVLIRVDEIVAFSAAASTVAVVHVMGQGKARRARVKARFSPAATAKAAWAALSAPEAPDAHGDKGPGDDGHKGGTGDGPGDKGIGDNGPGDNGPGDTGGDKGIGDKGIGDKGIGDKGIGDKGGDKGPGDTGGEGGVSPALAVAIGGGALGVACGAATIGLYADLARQANAANEGTAPLPESFETTAGITWALAGCTAVSGTAAIIGAVLAATAP